jgi:arylsulfatase A-like enzyme/tetratricopeptide (TPR) repeat protein
MAAIAAIAVVICGIWLFYERGRKQPSLLLITLDTTRADRLGCYGYGDGLTPALDRLASEGVLFEQAFTEVPTTLPSHATIMTGLHPPEHGLRVNGTHTLDIAVPTLAEMLRGQGYRTAAFIASATLDSQNGLDRGFESYQDDMASSYPHDESEPLTAYRPGDAVTDLALEWLANTDDDRPFFCWVHLFDPHNPYFEHEALAGTRFEGEKSYDAEVAFMDMQVARLVDHLESSGMRGSVLVVAAGDHGEGLAGDRERGHGFMLYEPTLRVPLIFSQPGRIPEGRRIEAMVSLVDLHPTILEMLGFDDVEQRSGRSLAQAVQGGDIEPASCYGETELPLTSFGWSPLRSLTTPRWKYIRSPRRHLYDRAADPLESENLFASNPGVAAELERELRTIEEGMTLHAAAEVDLTAEEIQRLASLGYVTGPSGSMDHDYSSLRDVEDGVGVLQLLQRASELGRERRHEELIDLLREILELSPESVVFRKKLATALLKAGRTAEGTAELREYLEQVPEDPDALFIMGVAHARRNEPLPAARFFLKAIEVRPDHPGAHDAMANLLLAHKDPIGASRHENPEHGLPPDAVAHYDMGVILTGRGMLREAVVEYERALELAPHDLPSRYRLAGVLELAGETGRANEQYAAALKYEGGDPLALARMGRILAEKGNHEGAALFIGRALELDPANDNLRRMMADLQEP